MTSSQYGPYALGCTRATMAGYSGMQNREVAQILKICHSSDWSLQLDSMKSDSLVMAHQLRRREYVPGPCTHRPSHHESCLHPKSLIQPVFYGRKAPKVWVVIGMKS